MQRRKEKPTGKTPSKRSSSKSSSMTSTLNLAPSHSIESLNTLMMSATTGTGRRARRDDADDFDDNASTASAQSLDSQHSAMEDGDFHPVNQQQLALSESLELLGEKRPSYRMNGLKQLMKLLTQSYVAALIAPQQETIVMHLVNTIKKGELSEGELACECLALLALTLGDDNETVLKLTHDFLTETMKNKSRDSRVRAGAINALSFMTYLHSTHPDDSMKMMDTLLELLPPALSSASSMALSTETVDVALFDSWGLLASALPRVVQVRLLSKHLNVWLAYLKHESVDVRMSVGEDIALLFQAVRDSETSADTDTGSSSEAKHDVDESKSTPRSSTRRPSTVTVLSFAPLLAELRSLSTDASRRRTRKDRKEQRASFREILSSVELGLEPSFNVTINKIKHEVVGWQNIKQWHALTSLLGSSLVAHILGNPTVSAMLDWANIASEQTDDGLDDRTRKENQRLQSRAKAKEDYQLFNKQRAKKTAHLMVHD